MSILYQWSIMDVWRAHPRIATKTVHSNSRRLESMSFFFSISILQQAIREIDVKMYIQFCIKWWIRVWKAPHSCFRYFYLFPISVLNNCIFFFIFLRLFGVLMADVLSCVSKIYDAIRESNNNDKPFSPNSKGLCKRNNKVQCLFTIIFCFGKYFV